MEGIEYGFLAIGACFFWLSWWMRLVGKGMRVTNLFLATQMIAALWVIAFAVARLYKG